MELFLEEHKKLWSRRYVRITVLCILVYVTILGGMLQYQWMQFGTWRDGASSNMDGYQYIRLRQEHAERYGGILNDASLQEMVKDYREYALADDGRQLELTDGAVLNSWLGVLYPELHDAGRWETMADYVDTGKLTDMYGRRQSAIEKFLDASGTGERERELLLSMNSRVQEPFLYAWTGGWAFVLGDALPDLGIMLAIGLIICLAPIFSNEWHDRTGAMLLSMKKGWKQEALAKIATGFCFTIELFTLLSAGNILMQILYLGTAGANLPIQCIKMIAIAPMNMLQAELYEYLFALLGAAGFAGMVMLFSAASRNNILSMIGSAALLFVPLALSGYLPYKMQIALDFIPLAGSAADIFRTYTVSLFGRVFWMPYVMPVSALFFALISVPMTVRRWARRQNA